MRFKAFWQSVAVAAVVGLSTSPVWAGDIVGTVTITTPIRTRPVGPRHPMYRSDGPKVDDEVLNVVVAVDRIDPKSFKVPTDHPVMLQQDKQFVPDVLPIVAGQTVDFPNRDHIYHDIYSETPGSEFEMTGYKGGDSKSRTFDQLGWVELFCGIHSGMNGYLLVLQNPFFAKPDSTHTFTIKNVPPGHYILKAWHPRVDEKTLTVDVPATGTVKADFTL